MSMLIGFIVTLAIGTMFGFFLCAALSMARDERRYDEKH